MASIDHFSHQHPLDPWKLPVEGKAKCSACEGPCTEQFYGCEECLFFLHKQCAELPRERKHPLHRPHDLKLSDTANYLGQIYCDACRKRSRGFTYRCDECDFDLDISCAKKDESGGKKSISHFSHEHELTLEEDDIVQEDWCKACEKRCTSPAYVCKECGYFLHESCAELPQKRDRHPLHPIHPLNLQTTAYDDGQVWCDFCDKKVPGFTYHCEECHFDLHVECALIHVAMDNDQIIGDITHLKPPIQIEHFGHRHTLVLSKKEEEDKILCEACRESCTGDTFGCELCEVFLHKSCAELPVEMNNPFHKEHPLKLQMVFSNICDNCDSKICGYAYRCDQCDFDLDIKCAQMLERNPELRNVHEKKKKDMYDKEILHFAHKQHQLKRSRKMDEEKRYRCMACEKLCQGVVYSCDECEFFLHESCAKLPERFQHYFHEHVLKIHSNGLEAQDKPGKEEPKITCRACEKRCRGFTYSCLECGFHMDVECTLMAKRKRRANYRQHFCHGHPLKLLVMKDMSEECSACKKQTSKLMYGCNKCRIYLHKSCLSQLQKNINHFFHRHDNQKLKLNTQTRNVKCKACRKECLGFTFNCEECDFNLDVVCGLLPFRVLDWHKFLGHGHPLKPIETNAETDTRCCVCEKRCSGPAYECGICSFYVHKACGELPENITHDFHPKHRLELKIKDRFKCEACLKESSGFTYNCILCPQFSLHVGCMDLKPIIKYDGHHHPLAFFESVYEKEELLCNSDDCQSEIPSSSEKQRDNVIRCVECNYNLHLLCGPLPCTINSKKHKHPLTLKEKFIEEGSDESYCDACEKERDPNKCVYKCERCPYVAAFGCCMESEVIELLQGKENHVKLRSLHRGVPGEVITEGILDEMRSEVNGPANGVQREVRIENAVSLDDLLDSFIEDEGMNLTAGVESLEKEIADLQVQINRILPSVSSYPNQDVEEFIARLKTSVLEAEFSMLFFEDEEIENVEEFMTIKSLVPTLKRLLHRHRDIVSRSEQCSRSKSFVFTMLCGAIRSMLKLDGQIQSLSETLLFNWWNHFMLARCRGFDIQFLMDHLKRITLVYFAMNEIEVQKGKLEELARKIEGSEQIFRDLEAISKEEELILANSVGSGLFKDPTDESEVSEKNVLGVCSE